MKHTLLIGFTQFVSELTGEAEGSRKPDTSVVGQIADALEDDSLEQSGQINDESSYVFVEKGKNCT